MFTSSYESFRATTSPSQASHRKLVEWYRIKNGVTLKFSTSEQIIIVNNQKSSQTLGPSRGSWSAHLSAVAALLVQQCCSKHMSRGCLQLFTDFRQVQFLIPCIYCIVPHITYHMINNICHINLQYLNNVMKPDLNHLSINYSVCNCPSYKNTLKPLWSWLQSSNLTTLTQ